MNQEICCCTPKGKWYVFSHGAQQARSKGDLDGVVLGPLHIDPCSFSFPGVPNELQVISQHRDDLARIEDYKQNIPTMRNLQRSHESFLIWAYLALRTESQIMMLPNQVKFPSCFFSLLHSCALSPGSQKSLLASWGRRGKKA